MSSSESITLFSGLALRLQNDPHFMSYVLAIYRQQEQINVEDLAQKLGTLPGMLVRLALCRRPDSNSSFFAEQVREIADYTLSDEAQLANVLRQVEALESLSQRQITPIPQEAEIQANQPLKGWLAAARDHNVPEEDQALPSNQQLEPEE